MDDMMRATLSVLIVVTVVVSALIFDAFIAAILAHPWHVGAFIVALGAALAIAWQVAPIVDRWMS